MIYDYAIIGGGILGLATAQHLLDIEKDATIILFEKEDVFAKHQTGHNSGVIHAGIYYEPGSLKAKLCREGLEATKVFCDEHKIPYDICGKLIVATNHLEEKRIDSLHERAKANGLKLKLVAFTPTDTSPCCIHAGSPTIFIRTSAKSATLYKKLAALSAGSFT